MSLDVGTPCYAGEVLRALRARCSPAERVVLASVVSRYQSGANVVQYGTPREIVAALLACCTGAEHPVILALACAEGVARQCVCGYLNWTLPRNSDVLQPSRKCFRCGRDYP